MIIGTGIDIIEVERIARALKNPRFLERVFSRGEREYILSAGKMSAQRAAGIFAAKEAAVKALGCGFSGVRFHDIEVTRDCAGKPELLLSDGALARFRELGGLHAHVSITHIQQTAAAMAIMEDG